MSVGHCRDLSSANHTRIGDQTHACDVRGQPLLDCGKCFDVYAQIDIDCSGQDSHCFLPQITHLGELILDYGNATFLLPTRDATAWASFVQRWNTLGKRFTKCQLPSFGAPRRNSTAALAQFYTTVNDRARAILTRAEKSHGLRWFEFDITDANAGAVLAKTVPGGGRAACWGQSNANHKNPT